MSYDLNSMVFAILLSIVGGVIIGLFVKGTFGRNTPHDFVAWRTQDWIWLVCFLLYAQVFTVLYKDMVMGVVSYVSTFVSIALGAVAIYISVREATKGDKVKDQMNLILGELREKLSQMDTKINRFDPEYSAVRDFKIDEITEKIKNDIEQNLSRADNISTDQVIAIINDQVQKATDDLKSSLNVVDANMFNKNRHAVNLDLDKISQIASYNQTRKYVYSVIEDMTSDTKFNVVNVRNIVSSRYNVDVLISAVYMALENLIQKNIVEDVGNNIYRKI